MQILTDYDFVKASKILNAMFQPVASDPGSPVVSMFWFNTTADRFKGYDGSDVFSVPRIDKAESVTGLWAWNPSSGSVPFTVNASKTGVVSNLNADLLDGYHADAAATADTIALRDASGSLVVATPTLDGHAATKSYVDSVATGNSWKEPALVATTGALPSYSHSAGVLTASVNGEITAQDGVTLVNADRVLVKNESGGNAPYNGIYVVTDIGDLSNPWVLTRATDSDVDAEVTSGLTVFIEGGTVNAGAVFTLTTEDPITVGTTDLTFTQTGGSNIFTAGRGMVKSGTEFHFGKSTAYSTGSIPYASGASTIAFLAAGGSTQVLKGNGAAAPVWGQVDLSTDITGTLAVSNGGTGTTTQFAQGAIVFAGSSGIYTQDSSNLFWNDALDRLGVGTSSPDNELTVSGDVDITGSLGIGTDTPSVKLEINGASDEMLWLNSTSATGNPEIVFLQDNAARAAISFADSLDGLKLDSPYGGIAFFCGAAGSSTQRAALDSTGKLAVNTTSNPSVPLFVGGPDGQGGSGFVSDTVAVFDNADDAADACYVYLIAGDSARSALYFGDTTDDAAGSIDYNHADNSMVFRTAGMNVGLTIDSSQEVKIENLATGAGNDVVTAEDTNRLHKRTIDSRVWGSSLIDGSGTTGTIPKFSDSDTLADSAITDAGSSTIVLTDRHLDMSSHNRIIKGGFGALSTSGSTDWNDAICSRSGNGEVLLQAAHTNGPGNIDGTEFFHVLNFEYGSKNATGNRTQFALPYNKDRIYFRRNFSASWTNWVNVWTSGYQGAGSGMDSDQLDGEEGAYYLDLANSTGDTDDLSEGAVNLFHTDARARGAISTADSAEIAYNSSTGVIGLGTEAGRVKSGTIGDGASTSLGFTHNLGTRNVIVQVFRTGTPYDTVEVDVTRNTINAVTIDFNAAPSSAEYTVVVTAANG